MTLSDPRLGGSKTDPIEAVGCVFFDGSLSAWGGLGCRVEAKLSAVRPHCRLVSGVARESGAHNPAVLVRTGSAVDIDLLSRLPALRLIQQGGAGVDNIDLNAALARGVAVANVPTDHSGAAQAVAEHALALALGLLKGFGDFSPAFNAGVMGARMGAGLKGSTVGIIGYGRIGQALARMLAPFQVQIFALNRSGRLPADAPPPDRLVSADRLDDLLQAADIVVLACPLMPETAPLIGQREIALCRLGARLINIARGRLLDEKAALRALDAGRLGGLGLDVFQAEPPDPGSPLLHHPLVLASPHTAAVTPEVLERTAEIIVGNIVSALDGEQPCFLVN